MAKVAKCTVCGSEYSRTRVGQKVCSPACAISLAVANTKKLAESKTRSELTAGRNRLKSRSDWLKEAQAVFNLYIRLRDYGEPCISCGRHHSGQYHAGHYLSVGARPELRFEEWNVHKQCSVCNNHLSGNIVLYRNGLAKKSGIDVVEWLEGPHESKHYSVDDIKEIIAVYKKKVKEYKALVSDGGECK